VSDQKQSALGLQLLRRHLDERAAQGKSRVWLTDRALEQVGTLPQRARAAAARATRDQHPQPIATSDTPPVPTGDRRSQLDAINASAESCQSCRELGTLRDTMVFAVGSPDAELMFVGEAPGYEEERQREPFVGKAGQLLDKIITAMGLQREDIYLSNIVKFRPDTGAADQGTSDRKPTADEMAASVGYLRAEIAIVKPKLIVALGGAAMEGLLGLDGSVGRARGKVYTIDGHPAIVTYHPAYLLRTDSNDDKRLLWEDMLIALEHLGLPISDKQRGFFKK